MSEGNCPIWGTEATVVYDRNSRSSRVSSGRAGGNFVIDDSTERRYLWHRQTGSRLSDRQKAILSSWIWDQRDCGNYWPKLTPDVIKYLTRRRVLNVRERQTRLLRALRFECPQLDQPSEPDYQIYLAASESVYEDELFALWRYAGSQGLVTFNDAKTKNTYRILNLRLTFDGHAYLDDLERAGAGSVQGFVAMWFDPSMNDAFAKAFAPAIEDAGFKPMRVDRHEYEGKIDDEVIAQIRRSRFVVVDLTSKVIPLEDEETGEEKDQAIVRGSVYYEAGFAGGLGLPVIWTAAKDMPEAHFDVRQFNILQWDRDNLPDLRARLARRISAVVGDGPHGYRPPKEDKED